MKVGDHHLKVGGPLQLVLDLVDCEAFDMVLLRRGCILPLGLGIPRNVPRSSKRLNVSLVIRLHHCFSKEGEDIHEKDYGM